MKRKHKDLLWHIPLVLLGITMILPMLFMLTTALADPNMGIRATDNFLEMIVPTSWHWENFVTVWENVPFLRFYVNSIVVALVVTLGQVFTSALAAYAFARLRWRGRDTLFLVYLATLMVPGSVTMIPNFAAMKMLPELLSQIIPFIDWSSLRYLGTSPEAPGIGRLVGLDSYFALVAPQMFTAYGTFLLRQFFVGIPKALDEAATIDGCSYWQIFRHVIIPLSLPSLSTLSILTFMQTWGSLIWPMVVTNQAYMSTLPLGLQAFQGQYGTQWHLMMAAAILMLVPNILIFLFGQRFFIKGLTMGGVKE